MHWFNLSLQVQVHLNARALFAIAIVMLVGDGTNTKFWIDRWLHGQSISDLAPNLIKLTNGQGTLSKDGSWVLSSIGIYSSKSVYKAFFVSSMNLLLARVFQSRWHFYDVSSFLWLAILNRCWTGQIRPDILQLASVTKPNLK